jgi:hypothetical protein
MNFGQYSSFQLDKRLPVQGSHGWLLSTILSNLQLIGVPPAAFELNH